MSLVLTAQELNNVIDTLDDLQSHLYKNDDNSPNYINDKVTFLRSLGVELLSGTDGSIVTAEKIEELASSLKSYEKMRLKMSEAPNDSLILKIKDWFSNNSGGNIVLEFEVAPEILGGFEIIYKGVFKDYTLHKSLQEYLGSLDLKGKLNG